MTNRPGMRTVKMDMRLYEQVIAMAAEVGIEPGVLVEEAVVYYLLETKEELLKRVQERMDAFFANLEAHPKYTVLPLPEVKEGG